MGKKNTVYERIEDGSETLERVEEGVKEALGAQEFAATDGGGSPFSLWAVRSSLLSEMVSTGGRPGRRQASSRKKIAMSESEWAALDEITKLLNHQGMKATPGQVAGILLHQSITEVLRRLERVTASGDKASASANELTDEHLEETLESVLAAAASAKVQLERLRPVARELLRRMRDAKGADSNDK